MSSTPIIQCDQITKTFMIRKSNGNGCLWGGSNQRKEQNALKDITLAVDAGEAVGLVGLNGSGKTTLSRIIAGISKPTKGTIKVNGSVGILSPRTGLNGMLTGRENIYYKCLLLGFSMDEIKKMESNIMEFAEVEEFIDQPLKQYSSGMASRLGFAICAHTDPDILIVDEALAVGDQSYMEKCLNWMNEYRKRNRSVVFVSHTVSQMRGFCNRVMWLHKGECVGIGTPDEILPSYQSFAKAYNLIKNSPDAQSLSLKTYKERIARAQNYVEE